MIARVIVGVTQTLALTLATHRLFVGYSSLLVPPRVAVFTPNP